MMLQPTRLVDATTAAAIVHRSVHTIHMWGRDGTITRHPGGGRWLYDLADVYAADRQHPPRRHRRTTRCSVPGCDNPTLDGTPIPVCRTHAADIAHAITHRTA